MRKLVITLGILATAVLPAASSLGAQANNGPWWDPAGTGRTTTTREGGARDQGAPIYDRRDTRADGTCRAYSRDRQGNTVYARTTYTRQGLLVREYATRDRLGRYKILSREVVRTEGAYGNRGRSGRGDDRWDGRRGRDKNDRWDRNRGHDHGKHKGHDKRGRNGR